MTTYHGYDDAWLTPGWTAQNLAYPIYDASVGLDFPSDIPTVDIQGVVLGRDALPCNDGWVYLDNGRVELFHAPNSAYIPAISFKARINHGSFSLTVPVTDSVNLVPADSTITSWHYNLRMVVQGKEFQKGSFSLPTGTSPVNVRTLLSTGYTSP